MRGKTLQRTLLPGGGRVGVWAAWVHVLRSLWASAGDVAEVRVALALVPRSPCVSHNGKPSMRRRLRRENFSCPVNPMTTGLVAAFPPVPMAPLGSLAGGRPLPWLQLETTAYCVGVALYIAYYYVKCDIRHTRSVEGTTSVAVLVGSELCAEAQGRREPELPSTATLERGARPEEFVAHGSTVKCLAIGHKSGRVMVTGGEDNKVNLWAIGKTNCIMSQLGSRRSPMVALWLFGSIV
ncbi:hypothetical protein HPB52_011500 [Rhipicephalus sanguineus]|uniref:Uncharacterized protein n=1 Tax=Rhipicephalus sanguineus TaxID=34632 RepID=A0A9D4T9L1_RHISA|nr:hypothetical protein HPB52_011500 [Rhipicephalus sanguineus]